MSEIDTQQKIVKVDVSAIRSFLGQNPGEFEFSDVVIDDNKISWGYLLPFGEIGNFIGSVDRRTGALAFPHQGPFGITLHCSVLRKRQF